MNILDLLDRPIAFHRCFVTITGNVKAALMLSQAVYWQKRTKDPEGWFYKSAEEWEEELGLTRHEQDAARRILCSIGVMQEKRRGVPATMHFKIDKERLRDVLQKANPIQFAENRQSGLPESGNLDCQKPANLIAENQQSPIQAETTAETTPSSGGGEDDVVPAAELLERLRLAFKLSAREASTLALGGEGCKILVGLGITYGTLWRLEKLWKIAQGEQRKGIRIYHSSTLTHFIQDPTKDLTRARELFPPVRIKPPAPPRPAEVPPPELSEEELDASHERRYRDLVSKGLVRGTRRDDAQKPDLFIPPRKDRKTPGSHKEPELALDGQGGPATRVGDPQK